MSSSPGTFKEMYQFLGLMEEPLNDYPGLGQNSLRVNLRETTHLGDFLLQRYDVTA